MRPSFFELPYSRGLFFERKHFRLVGHEYFLKHNPAYKELGSELIQGIYILPAADTAVKVKAAEKQFVSLVNKRSAPAAGGRWCGGRAFGPGELMKEGKTVTWWAHAYSETSNIQSS